MAIDSPRKLRTTDQKGGSSRRLGWKLALVAVGMFGFGFAMVPLYGVFCDITGLGGRSIGVGEAMNESTSEPRDVKIRFLATTHSALPWKFEPVDKVHTVRTGELSEARYMAMNPTDQAIVGHATFNVVPPEASLYFVKTECFCFTEQLLESQQAREMPVYYFIQPDLPDHIREITLSYTFYRNEDAQGTGRLAQAELGD